MKKKYEKNNCFDFLRYHIHEMHHNGDQYIASRQPGQNFNFSQRITIALFALNSFRLLKVHFKRKRTK